MKVFALNIKDVPEVYLFKPLLSLVDKSKRERLVKFKFQKDLQRGLFADLLIRKFIIENYNTRNKDIYFSVNEYGKPYCEFIDDFYFNVSHSGNWVVCAVDNKPVGVDIEKISAIDLDISKNFFSDKEHNDLMLSNYPFDYFFALWSLKESYIKFIGKGLSYPLNSFSMNISGENNIRIDSNNKTIENIYFKQYEIDKGYKMAVCSLKRNMPENPVLYVYNDILTTFIGTEYISCM